MAKTEKGGRYIVDGKWVNAKGEPLKGEAEETTTDTAKAGDTDVLAGIDFASDPAAKFARDSRLVAADFEKVKASGATGYTKADVEGVVEKKTAK